MVIGVLKKSNLFAILRGAKWCSFRNTNNLVTQPISQSLTMKFQWKPRHELHDRKKWQGALSPDAHILFQKSSRRDLMTFRDLLSRLKYLSKEIRARCVTVHVWQVTNWLWGALGRNTTLTCIMLFSASTIELFDCVSEVFEILARISRERETEVILAFQVPSVSFVDQLQKQ